MNKSNINFLIALLFFAIQMHDGENYYSSLRIYFSGLAIWHHFKQNRETKPVDTFRYGRGLFE